MEFMQILRSLGVSRGVATLITYLANVEEATSRDIEMGAGLRQPEVSIGMRKLYENKWTSERYDEGHGKGQPRKIYKLSMPLEKIIEYYESRKKRESVQALEALQKLRDMMTS
jgi:predicted transcriptional regulator